MHTKLLVHLANISTFYVSALVELKISYLAATLISYEHWVVQQN